MPPTGEVQQIISVSAERTRGELADLLRIEKVVGPSDPPSLFIEEPVGRSAGRGGRLVDQSEFHRGCACSRQAAKSGAVAPLTKELLGSYAWGKQPMLRYGPAAVSR